MGSGTRLLAVRRSPAPRAAANVVFQLLSRRYERGSIILTSYMAFSEWGSFFADDVIATAILDRLLHQCDVIAINGPSYRLQYQTTSAESSAPLR
jgi:DNA replication protein DnaC